MEKQKRGGGRLIQKIFRYGEKPLDKPLTIERICKDEN